MFQGVARTADKFLDFGEVIYMVDSDYRTAAQGWSRADRTGPLDLYLQRAGALHQYAFRTGDYASDAAAIQAAINAAIDFRGDALLFTPGAYSVATALSVDVPDLRLLGPRCSSPQVARASITAAVAAAVGVTAAADRLEVANLQLVPLTAATMFDIAAITGLHVHDTFYNVDGIAANVATKGFVLATSAEFARFDRNYVWVDGAQGGWIEAAGIMKGLHVSDFTIVVEAGTWAAAIVLSGVGAANFDVGPGFITGGGTALTSLGTIADKTSNTTHGFVHGVRASTVGPAANSLFVGVAAAEVDIVDCWRAVATDTSSPTFTSGNAISWVSGLPYTG